MDKEEMDENTIPFAKRSKMVSRCGLETSPTKVAGEISQCYDEEFWDRLSQQPRFHWMEQDKTSPTMISSCVVQRPSVLSKTVSQQYLSGLEVLPAPAQLCRRKRSRKFQNSRVMSFYYHLEDLKKRQSAVDQLKNLKWGGYGHKPSREFMEACTEFSSSSSIICAGEDCFLSKEQLIYPQWSPNVEETFVVPGAGPLASYVMATADRHNKPLPPECSSLESFWQIQNQPEE